MKSNKDTDYMEAMLDVQNDVAGEEPGQVESLLDFFPEKAGLPTDASTTVKISDRFPEFRLQALSEFETDQLEKSCTTTLMKKGRRIKDFDQNKYLKKLVVRTVQHPNFNDSEFQQKYNVMGAESLVGALLTGGEYAKLAAEVSEINGFEPVDASEIEEQVKN